MRQLLDQLGDLWCEAMHTDPMWPIGDHYQCRVCLRSYPVPFASGAGLRPARPS